MVVESCEELDLVLVAPQLLGIHSGWLDQLDGDVTLQELIPGPVDGAHRAAPDLVEEAVPTAEERAGGGVDRHC
jgi:hypothetical protein